MNFDWEWHNCVKTISKEYTNSMCALALGDTKWLTTNYHMPLCKQTHIQQTNHRLFPIFSKFIFTAKYWTLITYETLAKHGIHSQWTSMDCGMIIVDFYRHWDELNSSHNIAVEKLLLNWCETFCYLYWRNQIQSIDWNWSNDTQFYSGSKSMMHTFQVKPNKPFITSISNNSFV